MTSHYKMQGVKMHNFGSDDPTVLYIPTNLHKTAIKNEF